MDGDGLRRDRNDVTEVARSGPDWVSFAIEVTDTVQKAIPFDRYNCHTVGPGTVLVTGSVNRDGSCSGTWLAEHEYAIEDVPLVHRRRRAVLVSPAAEHWIAQLVEEPPPGRRRSRGWTVKSTPQVP